MQINLNYVTKKSPFFLVYEQEGLFYSFYLPFPTTWSPINNEKSKKALLLKVFLAKHPRIPVDRIAIIDFLQYFFVQFKTLKHPVHMGRAQ